MLQNTLVFWHQNSVDTLPPCCRHVAACNFFRAFLLACGNLTVGHQLALDPSDQTLKKKMVPPNEVFCRLTCLGWILITTQISLHMHRVVSATPLKGATELGQGAQEMDTRCANSIRGRGWEQPCRHAAVIKRGIYIRSGSLPKKRSTSMLQNC